ncbi:MAG: hypothetical protein IJX66_03870 [Lachnospiraceae bacterium]|nr:hypothetical protein [Lachnospiraceae bacterium]
MGTDYRECMMNSRMSGKAMDFSYKEHSRETVLKQLKDKLILSPENKECCDILSKVKHETIRDDMLWILKKGESVERGIYSWNRPAVDLAIVAPPALMALVMGEYQLAVRLCIEANEPLWDSTVEELYQEGRKCGIGGGSYTFGEACLLSGEMGDVEKRYFWKNGYYNEGLHADEGYSILANLQFHGSTGRMAEDKWRPIQEVKDLEAITGQNSGLLTRIVEYAMQLEMDKNCEAFWERLYETFPAKKERREIVTALHKWLFGRCKADNIEPGLEDRLLAGIFCYFVYERRTVRIKRKATPEGQYIRLHDRGY